MPAAEVEEDCLEAPGEWGEWRKNIPRIQGRRALRRAQSGLRTGSVAAGLGSGLGSRRSPRDSLPLRREKTRGQFSAGSCTSLRVQRAAPPIPCELGLARPRSSGSTEHEIAFPPCYDLCRENGGKARLLICPYCQILRRGLYGWELGGPYTARVTRSTWGCSKCNSLRYASEGGALVHHERGAFGRLIESLWGPARSDRPEPWLPYVFTSPEEAVEAGLVGFAASEQF